MNMEELKKSNIKIIDDYLEFLKYNKNYSDKTIKNYRIDLEDFFELLKEEALDYKDVTYDILMNLFKHFEKKKLTNKSISRHISSIKGFYKYLVMEEIINVNPFLLKKKKNYHVI